MKAIIIDDEQRARDTLKSLLSDFCPSVQVITSCSNVPDGVLAINKHKPDVVFLDIEMPDYNGFELLGFFRDIDFEIIFVTAYSEYAVKAFEVSAVDYLLKPVDIDQLKNAVEKLKVKKQQTNMQERLELMKDSFKGEEVRKIALPVSDGLLFVEVADIVMLEADGAYTQLYLKNGSKILISKKLKFFEDILATRRIFFRSHRSHLINVNFMKKYTRSEGTILMDNQAHVSLSRERKIDFEILLKELNLSL